MAFYKYSASAGSGKTFTLVKEYLKIALGSDDPMVFSRILAITFTNKAAREMTDRILSTLEELSGVKQPISGRSQETLNQICTDLDVSQERIKERARKTLKKIVHNYREFSVGTIDSFVHRVIRSFALELGLTQHFEIELNTDNVLKRAVDRVLNKLGSDTVLTEFVKKYLDEKLSESKSWKIDDDLYTYAKQILETHNWYYLDQVKEIELREFKEIYNNLKQKLLKYEKPLREIAAKAVEYALDGVEKQVYSNSGELITFFENIRDEDVLKEPGKRVLGAMLEGKSLIPKRNKAYTDVVEAKRERITGYFNQILAYREMHEKEYVDNKLIYENLFRVALLSEFDKELQKIKQENDLLLISDFNTLVGEIVRTEPVPFIYEKLGERYEHFLLDEFQDTSLMQWQNMLPLIENSLSKGGVSLVVGDSKQSIYRWRGGVVQQFDFLPEVYNPYDDDFTRERGMSVKRGFRPTEPLTVNYRSYANIVNFNNYFFREAAEMNGEVLAGFYSDIEQKPYSEEKKGLVEFRFLYESAEKSRENQREQIARLISELVHDGYTYSEIAILTRATTNTPALVEYLSGAGVPVISSESMLVSNSIFVKLIVSVLKHMVQPAEKFYMSKILIGVNDIFGKEDFHEVIRQANSITEREFVNILRRWGIEFDRKSLLALPLYELVAATVEMFGGTRITDHRLAAWMNYVFEVSKKVGVGLYDFLEDWSIQESVLSTQIPVDVNAVQVLTVHKAKGLDWPVVIMAEGNFKEKSSQSTFWVDVPGKKPVPAIILKHNKVLLKSKFAEQYIQENDAMLLDNLNVLYVAFTRPAERLYVFVPKIRSGGFFTKYTPILENLKAVDSLVSVTYEKEVKETKNNTEPKKILTRFSYGRAEPKESTDSPKTMEIENIPNRRNSKYRQKLKVRKNYVKRMNHHGQRDFGNLVHKAFSYIKTRDDVDEAVELLYRSGEISDTEKTHIRKLVLDVVNHPRLVPLFSDGVEVRNEAEILLPDGSLLRPDRVVVSGGQATVIDFKTGMKNPKHEKQVLEYKQQLLAMGYAHVQALLVFTNEVEVEEVT